MKAFLMSMAAVVAAGSAANAQAEVLASKGNKATLRVEYVFTSEGKYASPSKDQRRDWRARRSVTITGNYVAEAPVAMGALHKDDPKQKSQMAAMEKKVNTTAKNMEPTMNDMMAITEKCESEAALPNDGQDEAKFEACIGRAITTYKMSDDQKAAAGEAKQVMSGIQTQMSAQRFQMWTLTTQDGQYAIDETYNRQVFELTCTETKICRHTETRKGGGKIPSPAGKPGAGVSMLEVDAENKDMILMLPMPLAPLEYTQTVTSTVPEVKGGTQKGIMPINWMMKAQQITVPVPADLKSVTGSKTYPIEGQGEDKGSMTVTWTFTRN